MPGKNSKVKLGLKNLAMLPSYFEHIFVHLRKKARLRPELSPKFLSTLGPNPARTRPEKPGSIYNFGLVFTPNPKGERAVKSRSIIFFLAVRGLKFLPTVLT